LLQQMSACVAWVAEQAHVTQTALDRSQQRLICDGVLRLESELRAVSRVYEELCVRIMNRALRGITQF